MDKHDIAESLPKIKLRILDYICGNGEVSYFLAHQNKEWTIYGCDSYENLKETLKYYTSNYPKQMEPSNVFFLHTSEVLSTQFDYVLFSDEKPTIKTTHFIKIRR